MISCLCNIHNVEKKMVFEKIYDIYTNTICIQYQNVLKSINHTNIDNKYTGINIAYHIGIRGKNSLLTFNNLDV